MRTYQLTAFVVLDRYVILSGGHNSDAGVDRFFHNAVKHIRNRTARFRCVFGNTDGYTV